MKSNIKLMPYVKNIAAAVKATYKAQKRQEVEILPLMPVRSTCYIHK